MCDGLSAVWMLGQTGNSRYRPTVRSLIFNTFFFENWNLNISTVFTSAVSAPGTVRLSSSRLA